MSVVEAQTAERDRTGAAFAQRFFRRAISAPSPRRRRRGRRLVLGAFPNRTETLSTSGAESSSFGDPERECEIGQKVESRQRDGEGVEEVWVLHV